MAKEKKAAFCIIYCASTDKFLFEHRGKYVGNPLQYGFFGGTLEDNETPVLGLRRELREETGYAFRNFDFSLKIPGTRNTWLFVKTVAKQFIPKLSWESLGYKWVSDLDDVKPLHKKIAKNYALTRRLLRATRTASSGETDVWRTGFSEFLKKEI